MMRIDGNIRDSDAKLCSTDCWLDLLIRQALGHSNIATTERYVNSVLELDHAATDIWAGTLDDEDEEDEQ